MIPGVVLFGRYAFPPNRLGYCGPSDHASLAGYLSQDRGDGGLRDLARRFEGAYPYLQLIAGANGIPDPFDRRVVEAYWIGNALLDRVGASPLYESLKLRFRPRMSGPSFASLVSHLDDGTPPHHNFHVFEIYRRAGLLRDERATVALDRMDQCRVSWGHVRAVTTADLVVDRRPLVLVDGKLALGAAEAVTVLRRADDSPPPVAGAWVSIHWGWACDRLSRRALESLQAATRRAIDHTNLTL
ncbi:MAG TPA: DUF6390 family protein [Spirochaetia bacterium]|nr:DUF6390 family protein [Spirochaetia bacterium]